MKQKLKDKRTLIAITAVTALVIALAASFAWYSFNQRKQNIFNLVSAPNVNLHDDFVKGPQKDVYVENSGLAPVLVRVKLSELISRGNTLIPDGAVDDDEGTGWHIHTPSYKCEICDFEAHKYFTWVMEGQKFYMPAHKSAKGATLDDGSYAEPTAIGDKKEIIDYGALLKDAFTEIYADDPATLETVLGYISGYLGGDDTSAKLVQSEIGKIPDSYTVKNVKQYEGQPEEEYERLLNEVRLTLIPGGIITMDDWIRGGTYGEPRKTGDFWVVDSDGWCYWANALEPEHATGQLLSAVQYGNNYSGEDMVYKIKVTLNATTFDDAQLGTFFLMAEQNGGITEQSMILMFLASGKYIIGEDNEVYLIEGNGMYRKIIKNNGSYINYTVGGQVYAAPGSVPGGSGGVSVGGGFSIGGDGKLTDGSDYIITYIGQGGNGVIYLETEGGIYFCPVDGNGNPDSSGDRYAAFYPGADGAAGTSDDIGPVRADGSFPQWYLTDIEEIGANDVIDAGEKGRLVRADSAGDIPAQAFGVEQSVYRVLEIVRGENMLLYLKLDEALYAVALDAGGSPVMLTKSEIFDGVELVYLPDVYYIVYPGEDGKIGTDGDVFAKDAAPWEGEGTEEAPYLIANAEQLGLMRDKVNENASYSIGKHFKQTADIDLNNEPWEPIGPNGKQFQGVYDGDGYTISGLYVVSDVSYVGLFGDIKNSTIKNLYVKGYVEATRNLAGGIVGQGIASTISNCVFSGKVVGCVMAGGIAGAPGSNTKIEHCAVAYGSEIYDNQRAGGIAGGLGTYGTNTVITSCYSLAKVTVGTGTRAGGIIGDSYSNYAITIDRCAYLRLPAFNETLNAAGNITTGTPSLTGYFTDVNGALTATNNSTGEMPANLLALLNGDGKNAWERNGASWPYPSVIRDKGWDGAANNEITLEGAYTIISTPAAYRYVINSINSSTPSFNTIANSLKYKLGADIDLCGIKINPCGISETLSFRTEFDGNGYTIKGVNIQQTGDFAGLFGVVYKGTVKNLRVEGYVSIENDSAAVCAGGIAAQLGSSGDSTGGNLSTISNCAFSGTVAHTASPGGSGLGGGIAGIAYSGGTVEYCHTAYGSQIIGVSGKYMYSGGIAGGLSNHPNTAVNSCYSLAKVTSTGDFIFSGGVIGGITSNNHRISNAAFLRTATFNGNLNAIGMFPTGSAAVTQTGYFADGGTGLTPTNGSGGTMPADLLSLLGGDGAGQWRAAKDSSENSGYPVLAVQK